MVGKKSDGVLSRNSVETGERNQHKRSSEALVHRVAELHFLSRVKLERLGQVFSKSPAHTSDALQIPAHRGLVDPVLLCKFTLGLAVEVAGRDLDLAWRQVSQKLRGHRYTTLHVQRVGSMHKPAQPFRNAKKCAVLRADQFQWRSLKRWKSSTHPLACIRL